MGDAGRRPGCPRRLGRALLLRCPRCGGRGILRHWFKLRHSCPTCRLVLERGESGDYWLGAYGINFVVAEVVAVLLIVAFILATLPDVPWDAVQYAAIAAAIGMPLLFFPFSRTLWLALDLCVRPTLPGDHLVGRSQGS